MIPLADFEFLVKKHCGSNGGKDVPARFPSSSSQ